MKLDKILQDLNIKEIKSNEDISNIEIDDIVYDSRKSEENKIFVALKGYTMDGHKYINSSYDKGVRVFLIEDFNLVEIKDDATYIVVENTRIGLSKISDNFFNHPSLEMTVVGITGTKGKTTVSHFIRDVFVEKGIKTGILGTIGCFYGEYTEPTANTTPESYEIHRIMRSMLDRGYDHMVMEVSSGGIMNHRVDDIDFDYGIFLNLSMDHVGTNEHPTFEHYKNCKAELFRRSKISILNYDDEEFEFFKANSKGKVYTYSIKDSNADFYAHNLIEGSNFKEIGLSFDIKEKNNPIDCELKIPLPGIYNIYNALSTIAISRLLDIEYSTIKKAFLNLKVNGRFNVIKAKNDVYFVIDYAHNGTSIKNVLKTIKKHNPNKIYLVVGSVGGRSEGRRHEIGEASRDIIDVAILTSDNQDFDNPEDIINEMKIPFENTKVLVYGEKDRKKAIELAYSLATTNDVILVAGKGHETYNLEKGIKVPYSDHEVVNTLIK